MDQKIFNLRKMLRRNSIVKPFNPLEAMARINSNIRRFYSLGSRAEGVKSLQVKNLRLDTEQCVVYRAN